MQLTTLPLALCAAALLFQDPAPVTQDVPRGPVVGRAAPAFRLNDFLGRTQAVGGEHEAWTVLAFYPKAMTPG